MYSSFYKRLQTSEKLKQNACAERKTTQQIYVKQEAM